MSSEIDNIFQNFEIKKNKKKKINSGVKGKSFERNLCKLLSERFNAPFERSVGSGNRTSQIKILSESAKNVLVGDISIPDGFLFTIECKAGYSDVNLFKVFNQGDRTIDSFLEQATLDAGKSSKQPMLVYKRDRCDWLVFIYHNLLPKNIEFDYYLRYREWTCTSLDNLLKLNDDFFFENKFLI